MYGAGHEHILHCHGKSSKRISGGVENSDTPGHRGSSRRFAGEGNFSDGKPVHGEKAGAVQAVCLIIMTVGTLIYTIKKDKIKTHQLTNIAVCVVVGLILGIASSFLGIGGGPINLVVLFFFFSMPTKTAAQNSLYIILFSQLASLCSTVVTKSVPDVSLWLLVLMIAGGNDGRILRKEN